MPLCDRGAPESRSYVGINLFLKARQCPMRFAECCHVQTPPLIGSGAKTRGRENTFSRPLRRRRSSEHSYWTCLVYSLRQVDDERAARNARTDIAARTDAVAVILL